MKVGVIGAGPAGLTAAYRLAQDGADVAVFEAAAAVGGFARSLRLWGHTVDIGPHRFFSSDPRVNRFWLEIVGRDYRMVNRRTRILYRGRRFDYPLRVGNALRNMGLTRAALCVASYGWERVRHAVAPRSLATFEDWVVARFGRRLYETFFKVYTEKLWGIPCTGLDADFAAQRIKRFSLGEAIKSMFGIAGTVHKTLVDQFAYPVRGTGMVYERMAERIAAMGGAVYTECAVRRVLVRDRRVVGLVDERGVEHAFDHVVSTMPLTVMVAGLPDLPEPVRDAAARLRYRNTILVYLLVEGTDLFPDQWLYVHSPEVRAGRVTNFRNWVPDIRGDERTSVLAFEYWCYDDDAEWGAPDADQGIPFCKTNATRAGGAAPVRPPYRRGR